MTKDQRDSRFRLLWLTSKTWGETQWQIPEETHREGGDQRDGRSSDDIVPPELILAQGIGKVGSADRVGRGTRAYTRSTSVREDGSVDADDLKVRKHLMKLSRYSRRAWQQP